MKIPKLQISLGVSLVVLATLTASAHAQTTWTFSGATNNDFATSTNWNPAAVPTLNGAGAGTALINNGDAVTYNSGPDFILDNGGTLEVSNGSWTQINGGGWIQLGETEGGFTGNGNILVDGGTFNQGPPAILHFKSPDSVTLFQ